MSIKENILHLRKSIPSDVRLVAVSKMQSIESIREAYETGQRVFGENRVQELIAKQPQLPSDIQWHLIGHLQTNKVKYIAPFVSMIESVDSFHLLKEVNKQASRNGRIIPCLLQFHIAEEETKFGLDLQEAREILGSEEYQTMHNVSIVGVMGMATFTDEHVQIRKEFHHLKLIYSQLKNEFFSEVPEFKEISMGMSGDYPIAIEEGSTNVRIGTVIFGERHYT